MSENLPSVTMFPAIVRKNDNPFISILVTALRDQGVAVANYSALLNSVPDALHIHWLEGIFWGRFSRRIQAMAQMRANRLTALARKVRKSGRRVVWTVHNLEPHDLSASWQAAIFERFCDEIIPLISDVICMSNAVEAEVRSAFPALANCDFHRIPHPHYADYFVGVSSILPSDALNFLNASNTPMLGMFGKIRPYKRIPALVRLLRSSSLDFRLIIGGGGSTAEIQAIQSAIGSDPRFLLIPRILTEPELVALMQECDLALFNFEKILNSGSVLMALSKGTPVLAPRKGAIIDLQKQLGSPWVNVFDGQISEAVLADTLHQIKGLKGPAPLAAYAPMRIANLTKAVYFS